jgi:hypothetical protein
MRRLLTTVVPSARRIGGVRTTGSPDSRGKGQAWVSPNPFGEQVLVDIADHGLALHFAAAKVREIHRPVGRYHAPRDKTLCLIQKVIRAA